VCRLIWRSHLLIESAKRLRMQGHYKMPKAPDYDFLMRYATEYKDVMRAEGTSRWIKPKVR
jgi:hypothetical protein